MSKSQETEKDRTLAAWQGKETWQGKEKIVEKLLGKWEDWGVNKVMQGLKKKFWPGSVIGHQRVVLTPKIHYKSWRETTVQLCQQAPEFWWYRLNDTDKGEEIIGEESRSMAMKAAWLKLKPEDFRNPYLRMDIYHFTKQHIIDWYGDKEKVVKEIDFSFYLFENHVQIGRETIAPMEEITDGKILREKINKYLGDKI